MIEELLPYYEKQLQEFGQQSREFAKKYPKIAQRLALNQEQIDDPHIERLIQAFSLISARIDKKLHDSYEVFTRSIFEVMFPQYLKPFPACSVVSFEDCNKIRQLKSSQQIPKKTVLKSKSTRGVQCEYRTVKQVELLPIGLKSLSFKTHASAHIHLNQNATLIFGFEIFNQQQRLLDQQKLPIYLDAISNLPLQVLDCIFKPETRFSINTQTQKIDIENPFELQGFTETESVLPIDQHTHHAYRLLIEYFCFPEKFNFLDLNLNFLKNLNIETTEFELKIHFKMNLNDQAMIRNYSELNSANFKLFATPIVNLFPKQAEPQKIDHQRLEYSLISDIHHPEYFQVYAITEMNILREKNEKNQMIFSVLPFFAMSHYHQADGQFYYHLLPEDNNNRTGLKYSIISKSLEPHQISSDFVSIQLLCCNRDLPYESYHKDQNTLSLNDSSLMRKATLVKRPNLPYYFDQKLQEQWRIISHLSLNNLSLMQGDAVSYIKELLELYNLPQSKENRLIINSIQTVQFSLTQKLREHKPFPLFVRGVKVEIQIDTEIFRGASLYIFVQVLNHLFNLKVQMNSYVDMHVIDSKSKQELYQCVQQIGGKRLL
ncbi:type VI secretion system baseplate subunit TssF [Acinetobacter pseudolwoffii]|uniref:Type VI secretion system baseplate subunit TssF n=1 Tax=Acinetobacter pseudolwoffii TaxID=2053287 RepID=A0A2H9URM0_9GAMM|nr:type VI secretion system baseplate subunit TssF [Acinetobacter pseudolwoffii]ENW24354.1 type VI secretion protein [Acinetobacter lwoffii NCTC 5866 = CIP 64.10 = NIPH 512]MDM1325129.1 type VI secretion system baseplate subunit TssF [Acinetobacter pseudolwoffii]PJI34253.1 type VI secretion system baseplate subunit TssF [Acinetobacter pseudolwoffii]